MSFSVPYVSFERAAAAPVPPKPARSTGRQTFTKARVRRPSKNSGNCPVCAKRLPIVDYGTKIVGHLYGGVHCTGSGGRPLT